MKFYIVQANKTERAVNDLSTITSPHQLNKVRRAGLPFSTIGVMSTTVGDSGADFLAIRAGLGKRGPPTETASLLAAALWGQLRPKSCKRWLY